MSVAKLQDREAEALVKLEKHLIELETLEDMIRMSIDDRMSILGRKHCSSGDIYDSDSLKEDVEQELPTADADDDKAVDAFLEAMIVFEKLIKRGSLAVFRLGLNLLMTEIDSSLP